MEPKEVKTFYISIESMGKVEEIINLHKKQEPTATNFRIDFKKDLYSMHILSYEVTKQL